MYISLWENYRGHPDNISFMQFSTKIDGFEQKDSQGFENSYNSYEQYPLEKFFIFTIYQNYTLALMYCIRGQSPVWPRETNAICHSFFFFFWGGGFGGVGGALHEAEISVMYEYPYTP